MYHEVLSSLHDAFVIYSNIQSINSGKTLSECHNEKIQLQTTVYNNIMHLLISESGISKVFLDRSYRENIFPDISRTTEQLEITLSIYMYNRPEFIHARNSRVTNLTYSTDFLIHSLADCLTDTCVHILEATYCFNKDTRNYNILQHSVNFLIPLCDKFEDEGVRLVNEMIKRNSSRYVSDFNTWCNPHLGLV